MRPLFALFLAGAILLSTPHSISAKAPTARITITGGGLTSSIQITDAPLLEMSQAWGTAFLDASQSPLTEAPQVSRTYEVTFYSRFADNDIRKTKVFYYAPRSATEQGFIYLPGKGTVWQLNAGTMILQGRDGRWNYASQAWEALIKPLIARGEADRGATSVSEASEVAIDGWTKPRPGWLYVLDPRAEPDHPGSRVWLLDPAAEKVMGSVQAGYDPDFALSPDGHQLYIASGERDSGELAVVDTARGTVLRFPFPERVLYQPWYQGLPPFSRMAVSSDGSVLWILDVFSPDKIGYQLRTFDTRSRRFLAAGVQLGNCGYGDFVPSSSSKELQFVCPEIRSVRFIQLADANREKSNISVKFPWSESCGVAEGFRLPDKRLAIVRTDGGVFELDTNRREFLPTVKTSDCPVPEPETAFVSRFQWPRSTDGRIIYLGYGPIEPDNTGRSREFRVLDTRTWKELGSVRTSVPFWSAVASPDGRVIYALAPREHGILVIDTALRQEKQALRVGQTPTMALVAP